MKKTEKIRYEIDPHNRLIYKKTGEESEVPRFRTVLDGNFEIDENNYVTYHVKKSSNSDIPQQIKFSGNYSLDADHNLILTLNKWNNQVEGNKLIIKTQLLDAKDNELAFSAGTRDSLNKDSIYILKLNGVWKAGKGNRLSFDITKTCLPAGREKGPKDKLTLQGSWKVNNNNEIVYTSLNILTFKGHWDITKNQRITYALNKNINSGFDFLGKWRLDKKFGLFFEVPLKDSKPQYVSFGADCSLGEGNTVEFKLKNNLNKDMDIGLKLSRNILKDQGEAFIGALKEGKELSLTAGIGFRW